MTIDDAGQFLAKFNHDDKFFDPVHLRDAKAGFSIKAKYPENIRYKPPKKENGDPDNVAVIWVVYNDDQVTNGKTTLYVRVANFSQYLSGRYDYDFDDVESPTKKSVDESNKTPKPIELEYVNDFFYDAEKEQFLDKKNKKITGEEILDKVMKDHCDTIHRWKGLSIRLKRYTRSKLVGVINLIIDSLIFSLKIFGRTLEPSEDYFEQYYGYKRESLKKLKTNNLDVFGYKAPNIFVLIGFFSLISYIYLNFPFAENGYEKFILENEILLIIHAVFFLAVIDMLVPQAFFLVINFLIKTRKFLEKKKFKFR